MNFKLMSTLLTTTGLMVASPVLAQTSTEEAKANYDEIIVTAQKREQTIIEVPQSIGVVSEAQLESIDAVGIGDFQKLIPGLSSRFRKRRFNLF